jgi:hypothetical protein
LFSQNKLNYGLAGENFPVFFPRPRRGLTGA